MDTPLSSIDVARSKKLRAFVLRTKRFPSYTELSSLFAVRSKNAVSKILKRLENAGLIQQNRQTLHWQALPALSGTALRGTVGASFPSPAEEELADAITLDDYLIENKQAAFLLRVTGDSMINAGIQPGDLVIVERGRTPQHNDIVIAQIDGQSTMKRFIKRGSTVELHAENPQYPPLRASEELRIDGVVVSCVRKYR